MIKKVVGISLIVLLQIAVVFYGHKLWKDNKQLRQLLATTTAELTSSNLELGRANTKIGEAESLVSTLSKQIQEEIKKREASISMYASLEAKYEAAKKDIKLKSTIIANLTKLQPGESPTFKTDTLYMCNNQQECGEVVSLPFSYEDFRLQATGELLTNRFEYKLTQRFSAKFIETKLPSGVYNHYAELYELDDKNNKVGKLTLTKFDVVKSQDLKDSFSWINPKVDVGIGYSMSPDLLNLRHAATGELGVSLSSYGITKNDLKWRFFRLGASVSTVPGFSLIGTPVQFNVGRHIKPFSNLWLSPSAGYNFTTKTPTFSLSITAVL